MATTVGSHSVSAFATPVNGGPLDANVVRGNDNTIRTAYVAHDADTGIHVQSSTLASRPTAGTAGRKWITVDTGVYKLWYDDGTTWHEVAAGNIDLFVIADEALVKGDVVKVTGYNNGTGAPRVAKVSSASDTAFGIVNSTSIANGATGYITNTGLILDVATNAFAIGDILYPNTSGGFTATKPTSGNYQPVAFVLRSNANNGVLYVEFSAPRIVERSDNTASTVVLRDASGNFSAGTITAGAVTSTGLVTFASLKGTGATTVTNILDEDNMASDSATALATQQSIKAYVDAKVATVDTLAEVLANGNTTGANNIIVSAGQKIQTPTIAAGDGTASATIANSTGVMTIASSVLTTTDINGGTIDGTTIGGSSAAAGTFTTVGATTGNITTVNATTVDATNVEVTNVKAKDGTASITIADSTGALTLSSALADSNLATISTAGKVANSATTATSTNTNSAIVARDSSGNFSAGTITANLTGNISGTAPAGTLTGTTLASNVVSSSLTSVGTLTSLTVSGDLTVDTSTLKVDSTNNRVGIGTASPSTPLHVVGIARTGGVQVNTSALVGGLFSVADWLGSGSSLDMAISAYAPSGGGNITFYTNGGSTERMRLDASGNLGLGVTPSAWNSSWKALQLGTVASLWANASNNSGLYIGSNYYYAADGNRKYLVTGAATELGLSSNGGIFVGIAASGTAGNNVTFTQAMTLDASSNLALLGSFTIGNAGVSSGVINSADSMFFNIDSDNSDPTNANVFAWGKDASTTGSTRLMTLDASGNLGVGTDSPSVRLHLKGANNEILRLQSSDATTGSLYFAYYDSADQEKAYIGYGSGATDDFSFVQRENAAMVFFTNATERARITSGGYFKASNAGTYLNATGSYHELRSSANTAGIVITNTSATYTDDLVYGNVAVAAGTGFKLMRLDSNSVEQFRVRGDGTIFAQNTTVQSLSDARLKENISDATEGLDVITALRPVRYDWKKGYGNDRVNQLGFIAQEVEAVFPEAVSVWEMDEPTGEVNEDGTPVTEKVDYKTVGPGALIPVLVKAIQELEARIAVLEAQA